LEEVFQCNQLEKLNLPNMSGNPDKGMQGLRRRHREMKERNRS
jgi:hypothetical protein